MISPRLSFEVVELFVIDFNDSDRGIVVNAISERS